MTSRSFIILEPKYNPCPDGYCKNGGTCGVEKNLPNNAKCECQGAFAGDRCDESKLKQIQIISFDSEIFLNVIPLNSTYSPTINRL